MNTTIPAGSQDEPIIVSIDPDPRGMSVGVWQGSRCIYAGVHAVPDTQSDAQTAAARDVLAERQRQISAEGWTPAQDDQYTAGDMASAAACYASQGRDHYPEPGKPGPWPWAAKWWKPSTYRRNLEKAGALILAEIERLDRATIAAQRQEKSNGQAASIAAGRAALKAFARAAPPSRATAVQHEPQPNQHRGHARTPASACSSAGKPLLLAARGKP